MLKDTSAVRLAGVSAAAAGLAQAHHGIVGSVWRSFLGFSVRMGAVDAQRLAAEPDVDYVEQDQLRIAGDTGSTAVKPTGSAVAVTPEALQKPVPSWGLDRIDQMEVVNENGGSALDGAYAYDDVAGEGTIAYVLGTGIDIGLPDLAGRADAGPNFVNDGGSAGRDCVGFTTKYADIIAGTVYGVAKRANVVSLRMAGCDSRFQQKDYLTAISWVLDNGVRPAVISQSIGDFCVDSSGVVVACPTDFAAAQVRAEETAYANGYLIIDGAGDAPLNGVAQNACDKATGAAPHTLYVGATAIDPTTHRDQRASFSDFGPCVTMWAPGADIATATGPVVDGSHNGSSFAAAAFVAGTAALFLAAPEFANATPAQIATELVTNRSTTPAVLGHPVIENLGSGSPDRLLYTGPPGFFTVGDEIAMAERPDGRLQLTGVNTNGYLLSRSQDRPGSAGWGQWTQSATNGWSAVGTGVNRDGRVELTGVTTSGQIYTRAQSGPNVAPWFNWHQADGVITSAALALNLSNKLELFGTNAQGQAFHRSQTSPGSPTWGLWSQFTLPTKVSSITATNVVDGRIAVFMVDAAGQVWHSSQTSPTANSWGPFGKLADFGVRSIAATHSSDGRLELIGIDSGGNPWRRAEVTAGSDVWTAWASLPTKTLAHVALAVNPADGRVQIDGVDHLGNIWQSAQQQANSSSYTPWSQVDGRLRP